MDIRQLPLAALAWVVGGRWVLLAALVCFAASCCNFVEATEPDGERAQGSGVC